MKKCIFIIHLLLYLISTTSESMDIPIIALPFEIWNIIIAISKNKEKNNIAKTSRLLNKLSHKNNMSLYIQKPLILDKNEKEYAMLYAAYHGNASAIKNLLGYGINPHVSNTYLPLMPYTIASWKNHTTITNILDEYDKNHKHNFWHAREITPFPTYILAIYFGDWDLFNTCLQKHICKPSHFYNPYYVNSYGNSLAHIAIFSGHNPITQWLLRDETIRKNISQSNFRGKSSLLIAVEKNNPYIVAKLLEIESIEVNNRSFNGMTPLHYAVIFKHYPIVKQLLRHPKIDVNRQLNNGYTSLHIAVEQEDLETVQLLLQSKKINLHLLTDTNQTPLDLSLRNTLNTIELMLVAHIVRNPIEKRR